MSRARVFACFPGTGKSYAKENFTRLEIADSDSSQFSWVYHEDGTKTRNPEFPTNYIVEIKRRMEENDVVFVSTHAEVIKALVDENIPFTIVHPARKLKTEYLDRYLQRGSDQGFIKLLDDNWDGFIDNVTSGTIGVPKICLMNPHDSMTDILDEIVRYKEEGGNTWL